MNKIQSAIMMGNNLDDIFILLNYLEINKDIKNKIMDDLYNSKSIHDKSLPLLNQSVFLAASYISFVWLFEYFGKHDVQVKQKIIEYIKNIGAQNPEIMNNILGNTKRDTNNPSEFLRTIRNAISHAKVEIDFGKNTFLFMDDYNIGSKKCNDIAKIQIPMNLLGKMSQEILYIYNDIARNKEKTE